MARLLVLVVAGAVVVVAGAAGCESDDARIDRVVHVHEDRMDAIDKKVVALSAEVDALRAQCAATASPRGPAAEPAAPRVP